MPVQRVLGGVTGVGGGHELAHTMMGFVGGCDVGKGYMMSGQCWLQSILYSSPVVLLRAFNTFAQLDEEEWEEQLVEMYPAGGAAVQWTAFRMNNMVENNLQSMMYFNKEFKEG